VWKDVSGEHIASIFRVEKFASEEPASAGGCNYLLTLVYHKAREVVYLTLYHDFEVMYYLLYI
jgi:hypothetical protein